VEFRVKHLDRQDIEEVFGELNDSTFSYQKDKLQVLETTKGQYYKFVIVLADNKIQISDCEDDNVFTGVIRNKSELVKLMQMLN
ncbi:hypothetical protein OEK97_28440, partial [Escherichia coli]|uniref:hypothetical protein n=1 Tax=Escherichia coli TaxID=562 RepID=UPI0021DA5955